MRERELSIRQAIGASRARLAQYLLSEAIVLACAGGVLASLVLFNIPSLLSWLTGNAIPPQTAGGTAGRCPHGRDHVSGSVSSRAWCSDGCRPCASVVP